MTPAEVTVRRTVVQVRGMPVVFADAFCVVDGRSLCTRETWGAHCTPDYFRRDFERIIADAKKKKMG